MLAVFAAFETDVRRERQLEGIAMATGTERPSVNALLGFFTPRGHEPSQMGAIFDPSS
jgi:hypothetical protein